MTTQGERLDFLIEAFKREASEYAGMIAPSDPAMKWRLLRSLMNVRPPGPLSEEVLKIQDAYLSARADEAGRVRLDAIPAIRDAYASSVPMITDGYNLPAKKVIHVVGPIVQDELTPADEQALAACYRNTLDLCAAEGLRSVAFCCLSTGVFRFPKRRAAKIAVSAAIGWLTENPSRMGRIVFNVFQDEDRGYYEEILS